MASPGDSGGTELDSETARFCAEVEAALREAGRFPRTISVRPGAPRVQAGPEGEATLIPTVDVTGIDRAKFYEIVGFLAAGGPQKPALDYPPVRRIVAPKRKPARKRSRSGKRR